MREIANNLCPLTIKAAINDYADRPTIENWRRLNEIYSKDCPCPAKGAKCELLKGIVSHILLNKNFP